MALWFPLICVSLVGCEHSTSPIVPLSSNEIIYGDTDGFIYTIDTDGSHRKKLFTVQAQLPACSPKGDLISAYWFDETDNHEWLVVFDVNNGVMRKLAYVMGLNEPLMETCSWSPDGLTLAFNRSQGTLGESDLFTVDREGKTVRQLTSGGINFGPTWSPNGRMIAYYVYNGKSTFSHVMNADGSDDKAPPYRPSGLVSSLSWSPDGASVVFHGPPDSTFIGTAADDIYISDSEGRQVRKLTNDGLSAAPAWSPDGEFIAFVSGRDGGWNIYVMRRDGSSPTRLTKHGKVLGGPLLWSPDGTKLLYAYDAKSQYGLSIGVADSDGSHDMSINVSAIGGFAWKQRQ
jgi:Tol biopolymer transport system component